MADDRRARVMGLAVRIPSYAVFRRDGTKKNVVGGFARYATPRAISSRSILELDACPMRRSVLVSICWLVVSGL